MCVLAANTRGVLEAADALLAQCASFIESSPCEAFCRPSERIKGGTLGKHARHVVDHFEAIVEGLRTGGVIDYDSRDRDTEVETDRAMAVARIERLRESLAIAGGSMASPVRIRVMVSAEGAHSELDSNVAREVFFATHHAIHHHAMMKAIAEECGVRCFEGFGTAPSTINFQKTGS